MFLLQHPRRKRLRCIPGQDRHAGLPQNWPVIKRGRHLMHSASVHRIPRFERAGVPMYVIIPPSVSDEEAKAKFPQGFKTVLPYLRMTSVD